MADHEQEIFRRAEASKLQPAEESRPEEGLEVFRRLLEASRAELAQLVRRRLEDPRQAFRSEHLRALLLESRRRRYEAYGDETAAHKAVRAYVGDRQLEEAMALAFEPRSKGESAHDPEDLSRRLAEVEDEIDLDRELAEMRSVIRRMSADTLMASEVIRKRRAARYDRARRVREALLAAEESRETDNKPAG